MCIRKGKKNIIYFKDIEINLKKIMFKNSFLSKLYDIILQNFINAKNSKKLVAGLYLNYKYINDFVEKKTTIKDQIVVALEYIINLEGNNKQIGTYEDYGEFPFDANSKYLVRSIGNQKIKVWIVEKNECIIGCGDSNNILEIALNQFYYQIFLSFSYNHIRIWEISEEKKKFL